MRPRPNVGGVLAVAGIEGLLANRGSMTDQGDDELTPWRMFIHLWREGVEQNLLPREAHAHQLLDVAEKSALEIEAVGLQSQLKRLGKALSKIEGRVIGSVRIRTVTVGRRRCEVKPNVGPMRAPSAILSSTGSSPGSVLKDRHERLLGRARAANGFLGEVW